MKIPALFLFIVLLTSLVVLPSSMGARDLKETDSVVQPQAGFDPVTGRAGSGRIPCRASSGKSFSPCFPQRGGSKSRCSTFSRSCPP